MSNIVINYIIDQEIDADKINAILSSINIEQHNTEINVYDFSIDKKWKSIIDDSPSLKINVQEHPYEQRDESSSMILESVKGKSEITAFANLKNNVMLNSNVIDSVDFDTLNNDDIGFLYFDYKIGNIRCYLQSNKPGSKTNTPIMFWSAKKSTEDHTSDNAYNHIYKKYMGLHIPKIGCTIIY